MSPIVKKHGITWNNLEKGELTAELTAVWGSGL
jgi:hypothetical protein